MSKESMIVDVPIRVTLGNVSCGVFEEIKQFLNWCHTGQKDIPLGIEYPEKLKDAYFNLNKPIFVVVQIEINHEGKITVLGNREDGVDNG